MEWQIYLFCFLSTLTLCISSKEKANWQQDLSDDMKIGVTTEGFGQAVLECSPDWMAFVITMDEPFDGVIYTRGSFHKRQSPCFKKGAGQKDLALKIPYKECGGKHDSSDGGYVNTVIVQHDDELIMPGDLAFKVICKDERTVTGSIQGIRSEISLVDPDPGQKKLLGGSFSSMSPTNVVTIKPIKPTPRKEEL